MKLYKSLSNHFSFITNANLELYEYLNRIMFDLPLINDIYILIFFLFYLINIFVNKFSISERSLKLKFSRILSR